MRIRRANPADASALTELERESPTSANWPHEHYKYLYGTTVSELSEIFFIVLEDPAESQSASLLSPRLPIAGYLFAQGVAGEWELHYIIVGKKYQGHGLATMLLSELIAHVRGKNGSRICLEVRASNQAAQALYRKFEFQVTRIRENYYPAPQQEDAICYMRALS
ncbi:MAG: ribosomal protein S18-alanine N-acetyltransferase [Candidatus Sulfotelmatobacter sp.]|jgi:ribosomal-protein-alanine acetyltransferase